MSDTNVGTDQIVVKPKPKRRRPTLDVADITSRCAAYGTATPDDIRRNDVLLSKATNVAYRDKTLSVDYLLLKEIAELVERKTRKHIAPRFFTAIVEATNQGLKAVDDDEVQKCTRQARNCLERALAWRAKETPASAAPAEPKSEVEMTVSSAELDTVARNLYRRMGGYGRISPIAFCIWHHIDLCASIGGGTLIVDDVLYWDPTVKPVDIQLRWILEAFARWLMRSLDLPVDMYTANELARRITAHGERLSKLKLIQGGKAAEVRS